MATFKQRKTDKSGSTSYAMDGVRSSVYFNKGIFNGNPPATIEITSDVPFTTPGEAAKVGIAKLSPEERAKMAADRKAKLAAMTPAEKAAARLQAAREALAAAEKAAAKVAAAAPVQA